MLGSVSPSPVIDSENDVAQYDMPIRIFAPPKGESFQIKDSGEREEHPGGFIREPDAEKIDFTYLFEIEGVELIPEEMLRRLAAHMVKGAEKYEPNNWRKARGLSAVQRFRRSAARHMVQWFRGEIDEDHAAAITFNIWASEIVADTTKGE